MNNLMDDVRKWKAVYRLLDHVSTEVYDCGTLCGSACCMEQKADEEMGIYLLPGEHLLLQELCPPESGECSPDNSQSFAGGQCPTGNSQCSPDIGKCLPGGKCPTGNSQCSPGCGSWLKWDTQDPSELGFPDSWTGPVYFVTCMTPPKCPRSFRPLQCRTFPLKPVIGENGVLEMIWNDEELPYKCPIIENNMPIHDDFYKATYTVWSHLLRDDRIFDLVLQWS